eukprot:g11825.t1
MEVQPLRGARSLPGSPRTSRSPDTSLARQIRRAALRAEAEEVSTQRHQLQEELSTLKRWMVEQREEQAQGLTELRELRGTLHGARHEEQAQLAELCREGQRRLGREVFAKMSELNEKLGEKMQLLEDELTARLAETVRMLRQEAQSCRCEEGRGQRRWTQVEMSQSGALKTASRPWRNTWPGVGKRLARRATLSSA